MPRVHVSRVSVDTCQVSPSQYIFVSTDLHPPLDVRWITMLIMLSSSDDDVIISIISDILVIQLSPPLKAHTALSTTRTRNCSPMSPGSQPKPKNVTLWYFSPKQNKLSKFYFAINNSGWWSRHTIHYHQGRRGTGPHSCKIHPHSQTIISVRCLIIIETSLPYFGVKLSRVCLKVTYS